MAHSDWSRAGRICASRCHPDYKTRGAIPISAFLSFRIVRRTEARTSCFQTTAFFKCGPSLASTIYRRGVSVDAVFLPQVLEGRGRSYPKPPFDCVKVRLRVLRTATPTPKLQVYPDARRGAESTTRNAPKPKTIITSEGKRPSLGKTML